ncbi:hypothetical protein [Nesterenkonia sp.]|uniref:hypothetical protein n=1 Tax=Nesterenkonia sp. TaxID=704201 RepID=UPI002601DC16|nr:hypothetical protein [Nesterenkonia sp.]
MADVALHLGAHKTATTWLQRRLALGNDLLAEQNINYVTMGTLRRRFSSPFDAWLAGRKLRGAVPTTEQLETVLGEYKQSPSGKVILSDENLMGDCNRIVRSGRVYLHCDRRLKALRDLLGERPSAVAFTIRSYPGFLASCYVESLRHGEFTRFDDFRHRILEDDELWLRPIRRIVESFGEDCVRVFRLERIGSDLPRMIDLLTGGRIDEASLPEVQERREGMSGVAVETLHIIDEVSGSRKASRAVELVEERFPRGDEFAGFRPWSESEQKYLEEKYQSHVEAIRAKWPGVLIE